MSSEYSIDALTDEERRFVDAIEADLDRMMAVEPSADFAARVRERIDAADRDGGWSMPWTLAAAAVLMIAAGILFATLRYRPASVESAAIVTGYDIALPAAEMPRPVVAANRPVDAASASVRPPEIREVSSGSRIDRQVEPEVLVPNDLRLAVARVMRMVRAGTISERAFPLEGATVTVEEPAEAVGAMVIEELQVPPIDPAGGSVEKGFGGD
jgi:hypothetical protein